MSFPNQKKIIINKPKQTLFLMVGREDVLSMSKVLSKPCAIALYLYLACNKDGHEFDLSLEAYTNATGFDRSSYYRAINKLIECGYIYEDNCGRLNFATSPKKGNRTQCQNWEEDASDQIQNSLKSDTALSQMSNNSVSEVNREIKDKEKNKKEIKRIETGLSEETLSYLKDIVSDDGSFEWDGETRFIDGNEDLLFYSRPREYQIKVIKENSPFTEDKINYILDNIIQ